jgi:nitrite reductase/ring-hydroxylating ferredoxin subunit
MKLCELSDISPGSARGVEIDNDQDIFIVCAAAGEIVAYFNRCPHTGASLNWQPDQFLDHAGSYIQCSNHDALFRIDDGVCIAGPCIGQSLTPFSLEIRNGSVFPAVDQTASRQEK